MMYHELHPQVSFFAFADDLALLIAELLRYLPLVASLFVVLAAGAGLELNFKKTVFVALRTDIDVVQVRRCVGFVAPVFSGCSFE